MAPSFWRPGGKRAGGIAGQRTRGRAGGIAGILAATLFLAACGPSVSPEPGPSPGFDPTAGTDPALVSYYSQEVKWKTCKEDGIEFRCANVLVPLDYGEPDRESIPLAVRVHETAGPRAPTLFLNPGGPGGSGTEMVGWARFIFNSDVTDVYNLAGFDPRGVEDSAAIECLPDAELDAMLSTDSDLQSDEGIAAYEESVREFAGACKENTGPLLQFVDSRSVVRDMDILRAVVGRSERLNFFGFSYGSFLGALYAEEFTDQVGRFVFDGAMDPALSLEEVAMGQALGFDRAVQSYMANCLAGTDCWHHGSAADGLAKLTTLFAVARSTPLPTSDPNRPLTESLALTGVLTALYSEHYWQELSTALDQAINRGEGSGLLSLADAGNSRNPDGSFDGNSNEAFLAISCLDYPVVGTLADWRKSAAEMSERYPTFGDAMAFTELVCVNWPYQSTATRAPVVAAGSQDILVVGTTRDPATPIEWAESLAESLENGRLLVFDGDGHTAYGNSSCIEGHVDQYLRDGTLPPEGTRC